jgi:hypothetical protein
MENTNIMDTTIPQPPQGAPAQEPPSVNVQDLLVLRSCMQVACTRGAFRAEEMQTVGRAFDKLNEFLNYVEAANPEHPAEDSQTQQAETQPEQGE